MNKVIWVCGWLTVLPAAVLTNLSVVAFFYYFIGPVFIFPLLKGVLGDIFYYIFDDSQVNFWTFALGHFIFKSVVQFSAGFLSIKVVRLIAPKHKFTACIVVGGLLILVNIALMTAGTKFNSDDYFQPHYSLMIFINTCGLICGIIYARLLYTGKLAPFLNP